MRVTERTEDGEARDAISHDWLRFLERVNITPVLVPNRGADSAQQLGQIEVSGVLLTNGNDVGPQPRERWAGSASVSEARDRTERALLAWAVERRMPVLGVCRGMQVINTYFGGTLIRDVAAWATGEAHAGAEHRVTIMDPAYRQRLGVEACVTTSFHNHGVTPDTLAPALRAMALSEAGVVEGCYHPDLPVVGIQWHPERRGPDPHIGEALFRYWLSLCEARSGGVPNRTAQPPAGRYAVGAPPRVS